jgi:hypothetical protein
MASIQGDPRDGGGVIDDEARTETVRKESDTGDARNADEEN